MTAFGGHHLAPLINVSMLLPRYRDTTSAFLILQTTRPGNKRSLWTNTDLTKMTKTKTFKVGRDPENGELVSVKKAQSNPRKYIIESMPKKGYGDTR